MLIGVVSDTHRDKAAIKKVAEELRDTDVLIHLGDNDSDVEELSELYKKKIISVRGNCDFMSRTPLELVEEFDGIRILITHGHKYDVKRDLLKLKYKAMELDADIALYGHTHISEISFDEGVWLINPGSPALPRDVYRSVGIIEIANGEVKPNIKII
jgi:putative phosphoesterase